jgi:hypothetical protein
MKKLYMHPHIHIFNLYYEYHQQYACTLHILVVLLLTR